MRITFLSLSWGEWVAVLPTIGAVFALGAMAFSGMMLLTSSWIWGLIAFLFAVAVEPEVYWQNIMEAVEGIQVGEERLIKRGIARHRLEEMMAEAEKDPKEWTDKLRLYYDLRFSLKKLKSAHGYNEAVEYIEKKIYEEEEKFFEKELSDKFQSQVKNRLRAFKFFYILTAASAISMSLTILYICYVQLATVGFLSSVFTGGAIPIAILAGIGYGMMMYKTACIVIAEDALGKCWKRVKPLFQKKEAESWSWFLFRAFFSFIGVTALLLLVAFATVATAGTCWVLAIRGAAIVGDLVAKGAVIISSIASALMAIPTFLFSLTSAFRTIGQLPKQVWEGLQALWEALKLKETKKTWGQLLNPFFWVYAIVECVWQLAIYIGHVLSVGLTSDRLPGVSYIISGLSAALLEFLQDLWSFMPHKEKAPTTIDFDDDHIGHSHHLGIAGGLLKIIMSPLLILAVLWDVLIGWQTFLTAWHRFFPSKELGGVVKIVIFPIIFPILALPLLWDAITGWRASCIGYETFSQALQTAWQKFFPPEETKSPVEVLGPQLYQAVSHLLPAKYIEIEHKRVVVCHQDMSDSQRSPTISEASQGEEAHLSDGVCLR